MSTTRRRFIQSTAAAAIIGPMALAQRQPDPKSTAKPADSKKLRILILGGTGFLGPAIVEAAQKDGHSLTLFNRGVREKTKGTFFEGAEHIYGNRDPKLDADAWKKDEKDGPKDPNAPKGMTQLEGKKWDAVIDTSGFFPRIVKASAELLAPSRQVDRAGDGSRRHARAASAAETAVSVASSSRSTSSSVCAYEKWLRFRFSGSSKIP